MLFGTSPSSSNTMASGSALLRTTDMAGSGLRLPGINKRHEAAFLIPCRSGACTERAANEKKPGASPGLFDELRNSLRALLLPHQIRKSLEEIMGVARAGRGVRMVLHREHRPALELDAA